MLKRSLVLFFLIFPPAIAPAQEPQENPVVELLKQTTVTVVTEQGSGSGSVIVRGQDIFILTAGHVVASLKKVQEDSEGKKKVTFEDCKVIQKVLQDGRTVQDLSYPAEVIRYSDSETGEDLAVLRLYAKGVFTKSMTFYMGPKIPPVGTSLWHSGSPLGEVGSQSVIPGTIAAHGRMLDKKVYDQASMAAFPGSSGGAITLPDGRWVGMVLRGRDGGFILYRPVRILKDWSKKVAVEFLLDPKAKVPTDEELKKKPIEDR